MTLEEVLRKAAEQGNISHISVSLGVKGWQANYRDVDSSGFRIAHNDDIVDALMEAMLGPKVIRKMERTGQVTPIGATRKSTRAPKAEKAASAVSILEDRPKAVRSFDDLLG